MAIGGLMEEIKTTNMHSSLYDDYEWYIPSNFNIASACCHRWAASPHEARLAAIYFEDQVGQLTSLSYGQLSEKVNKLANGFVRMGIHPQDRIAIALQHSAETAITILAAITVGAIAVPLGISDDSQYYSKRLLDCGARIAIVDKHSFSPFLHAVNHNSQLKNSLKQIIGLNTEDERLIPWKSLLARQPKDFNVIPVRPDTTAILLYSGVGLDSPNTKSKKGSNSNPQIEKEIVATVISHETLIGSLPGFTCSLDWFPQNKDIFFTTYDWSSYYGLMGGLLPTLYFGRTIVGCPSGRTVPRLLSLIEHYPVTNFFASPDELERIRAYSGVLSSCEYGLRCVSTLAEGCSSALEFWLRESSNYSFNKILMPVGFSIVISESNGKWPSEAGSAGKAVPGYVLGVFDHEGNKVKTNSFGTLHVKETDIHNDSCPGVSTLKWHTNFLHPVPLVDDQWFDTGIAIKVDKNGYYWLKDTM